MNAQRKSRVEHALRDALTEMIASDVKDPRVRDATLLTLTRVEVNVDMSVANVYVSVVGSEAAAIAAVAGLIKAAGFLRGPLGRRLHLQRPPELRFVRDVSIDVGAQLAAIVREDEERARAAGREPERASGLGPQASGQDQSSDPQIQDQPPHSGEARGLRPEAPLRPEASLKDEG
jgi:ribosome-binding factor A